MSDVNGFLMRLLNTVVLGAVDGYSNNRCDSDISFFDAFRITPQHVRCSPIPSQISSTLTVLQVTLANQTHLTSKRLSAWYQILKIPQS